MFAQKCIETMDDSNELDAMLARMGSFSVNAVAEIGIAAGAEKIFKADEALFVGSTDKHAAFSAYLCCKDLLGGHDDILRAIIAAAAYINKNEWFDDSCNITTQMVHAQNAADRKAFQGIVFADMMTDTMNGLTLLIATKVNFFQMNHHVGQGRFQGYIKKVVESKFSTAAMKDDTVYESVWKLGHWASTRGVMQSLGFKCGTNPLKDFPGLSADVKLRIQGYPAGTAKLGICVAIVRRAIYGMYYYVLPSMPGYVELDQVNRAVKADPMKYHVGANHLVSPGAKVDIEISEETMNWCAAYAHAVAKNSTITKSPVLPGPDMVSDHEVTKILTNLKIALAKKSLPDKARINILEKSGTFGVGIADVVWNNKDGANSIVNTSLLRAPPDFGTSGGDVEDTEEMQEG